MFWLFPFLLLIGEGGMASLFQMPDLSDEKVWEENNKPQQGGAVWGTEFAFGKDERRGIGLNRWMKSAIGFIVFESTPEKKNINK